MTDHADTIRRDPTYDELAAKCGKLLAERQQAIDERDAWKLKAKELDDRNKWRWPNERARAEQAIDALREIVDEAEKWQADDKIAAIARAALLSLGEQP